MSQRIAEIPPHQLRHRRVRSRISGTAARPRLSVYRSLREMYVQLIDDETGRTLVKICDRDVLAKGPNAPKSQRAFLVGQSIAREASKLEIAEVVFDRGGYKYHGRVRAVAEGARDGGLKF